MTNNQILVVIIASCLLVLLIAFIVKKTETFLNFILKGILGLLAIYITNSLFASYAVSVAVGLNLTNSLVIGLLGTSGYILLYALALYNHYL